MVSKSWLLTDYADVVALIERIEAENRAAGKEDAAQLGGIHWRVALMAGRTR